MFASNRWSGRLGVALLLVSSGSAFAQVSTATQRFVGANLTNPVLAVELDAAPDRMVQNSSGPSGVGLQGSAGGGAPEGYGARVQSQTSPPTFTGAGGVAGSGGTTTHLSGQGFSNWGR